MADSRWVIGETVPWSVSWTGEDSYDLAASANFPGYADLMQAQAPGQGVPKFAAVHVTRQRIGMLGQLCHVCGRRTLARDRYLFPVESGGFVAVGDRMRYAGTVPPVHLSCARRARALCPHLGHALAEPVMFPPDEGQVVPHPGVPAGMEELAARLPAGVRVAYSCLRVYGPRFSRTVERLRKARGGRTAESWTGFSG